ncbi:MAG: hypothetical protein H6R36_10 [Chloroflexi bacterium]|nr:hypothetical protein [Chloroflexota bacterium]
MRKIGVTICRESNQLTPCQRDTIRHARLAMASCAFYVPIQSGGAIYAVDRDQYALDALVRGSDLEEGESQGLLAWSRHVGDPVLQSNMTRRVDYALFMVAALKNDELIHEAPAIVGCRTPSALAHAAEPDRYAQRVN